MAESILIANRDLEDDFNTVLTIAVNQGLSDNYPELQDIIQKYRG